MGSEPAPAAEGEASKLGRPFLVQFYPEAMEWLERERVKRGVRSRAEVLRMIVAEYRRMKEPK